MVSAPRIDRIRSAISASRYSIHDLSRGRGQGDADLARFNMPLELGFAMWRRFTDETAHDWLVLVPEGHEYLKCISDLGAFDPKTHQGTLKTVVPPVVDWLKTRPPAAAFPFPDQVIDRLPHNWIASRSFAKDRAASCLGPNWWPQQRNAVL